MQLEPRPLPVFKDPAKATSPELSDELLAEVQAGLAATIPPAFVELLRAEQNGGKLRRSLFPSDAPGLEGGAQIGYLLGLGGPRGLPTLEILAKHWKYPVEGLLLASEGPRALLAEESGAIVYVDMKHPEGVLRVELAPDFGAFTAGLVDGSPSCNWVLLPELKVIQERLSAAGWSEGENHYGIRLFTRPDPGSKLELRVLSNKSRDGEGFACVEFPECALVAQLHGPHAEVVAAAEALDAALGEGTLRVSTPHLASKPVD